MRRILAIFVVISSLFIDGEWSFQLKSFKNSLNVEIIKFTIFPAVYSTYCYRCSSLDSSACGEVLDLESSSAFVVNCNETLPAFMLPIKDNFSNELASYCTKTTKKSNDGQRVVSRDCGYTFRKPFEHVHSEDLTIDEILPIKTGVVKFDECLTTSRLRSNPVRSYCTCSTHLCNHSNKIESLNFCFSLLAVFVSIARSFK